jgi:hypothetical protein
MYKFVITIFDLYAAIVNRKSKNIFRSYQTTIPNIAISGGLAGRLLGHRGRILI